MSRGRDILETLPYKASDYQIAIAKWVCNGTGHAMVNAVAGSGKTSTLVDLVAPLLWGSALFCAFNKHIAVELGAKLRGTPVSARTLHSAGFSCVRYKFKKTKVDGAKYRTLLGGYFNECYENKTLKGRELTVDEKAGLQKEDAPNSARVLANNFVEKCRCTLTDPTEAGMQGIADHFGIAVELHQWALVVAVVGAALERGQAMAATSVDYTDMVWLPETLNLQPYQHDWVLVDECQDLNAAQLALARRLCKHNGRMLFVGDPNQAIYGFAGADCDSFWNIQKKTGAKVLPLSICYRCPSKHVALAQDIVPHIEAAPDAIEGGVHDDLDTEEMVEMLESDDVVLCRNTAPLVKACYKILREGKPAYVAGRAIGEGIAKAVHEACKMYEKTNKTSAKMADVGDAIDLWYDRERASLKRRKVDEEDQQWQNLADREECIRIFWGRSEADTVNAFLDEIVALFSDNKDNATRLSTVHRAKGLEADRVFILKPELMPSSYARMSWERKQEENLRYVALTRAKEALHFVYA